MKLKIVILAVAVLGLLSCNNIENQSQSGSKIILSRLTGSDLEGEESTVAFSDVITNGSYFNDNGSAYLKAVAINPSQGAGTFYQDVIIDQIDVEFFRTDGKNREGIDVPYRFVQPMNYRLELDAADATISFVVMRHVAKIEPPLIELINLGADKVLEIVAKITVHGKDIAGYRVEPAVGYLTVWCANFADPVEGGEDL